MARDWSKQELDFLIKELKKGEVVSKITELFNDEFTSRTYDSIQKKARRLRESGLEYVVKKTDKYKITAEQKETLDAYIRVLKTLKRRPSMSELEESGVTRLAIRQRWVSLKQLELAARVLHEDLFNEVQLANLLTPESRTKLTSLIGTAKRFVVTTAISGCRVHPGFLAAIDTYCQANNAELLVMIASDPAHQYASDDTLGRVDRALASRSLIIEDTELNNNLFLSEIKMSAKQIDPATGMMTLAQKGCSSYIFATPKQRLKFVPVPEGNYPPAIIGTGSITLPDYNSEMYLSRRTAYMAEKLHIMGAVIVEIQDEEIFHFRHIQANANGSFIDWGQLYSSGGLIKEVPLEALVCGDEHAGRQKREALDARISLCEELNPKRIVIHDLFDGRSISHHIDGKTITMAIRSQEFEDSLIGEFKHVAEALERYEDLCERIVVVKSNHDEHLVRYLEDGRFLKDPRNYRLSLDLAACVFDGKDPIQAGTEVASGRSFENVTWLQRDEDYVVAGVDLSHHGDRGPNGARGGVKSFANSVRASITGHSHTAEIYGSAWRVGTSTGRLDYAIGPSSWTNTDCLLYENGSRQMVNYIHGRYKA